MSFSVRRAHDITRTVEGWLTDAEAILLWFLSATSGGKGFIVEVGSWKGKSTIWLAYGSKALGREKVVAIDPHAGTTEHRRLRGGTSTYDEFLQNLALSGVSDWVTPIIGYSQEVAQGWVGNPRLIFIDGSHEYGNVKQDFRLWFELLGNGGIIALHDCYFYKKPLHEGPGRVVQRLLLQSPFAAHVGFLESITFCKKEKLGALNLARNRLLRLMLNLSRETAIPRVALLLCLLLDATDIETLRTVLWTYWQAIKLRWFA
jgi:predicted O-methyltransferase YrrM